MNQIITTGIVLSRTDFAEADRIVTMLTPDYGKLRAIAKGVRRPKSKLAGGIELFSVSNITYLAGRGDLGTLVSTRLITHFGDIVKHLDRTMLGYELLKKLHRLTEDAAGEEYYLLAEGSLVGLNDAELSTDRLELWFYMQLLNITGHLPNLLTDETGQPLSSELQYRFDFDSMGFVGQSKGPFYANHIKLLRLSYRSGEPLKLKLIQADDAIVSQALALSRTMLGRLVRI